MEKTWKRLAVLTVAVCLFMGIGVASKSFAQTLWVAGVDSQLGYLPVYIQPTGNSKTIGSLEPCTEVTLTGRAANDACRDQDRSDHSVPLFLLLTRSGFAVEHDSLRFTVHEDEGRLAS